MRVDASLDLAPALPFATTGPVEPLDVFSPDAPPAPTRDEGGRLRWTLDEQYVVGDSIVVARHELLRLE